jgi:hypothetical protein
MSNNKNSALGSNVSQTPSNLTVTNLLTTNDLSVKGDSIFERPIVVKRVNDDDGYFFCENQFGNNRFRIGRTGPDGLALDLHNNTDPSIVETRIRNGARSWFTGNLNVGQDGTNNSHTLDVNGTAIFRNTLTGTTITGSTINASSINGGTLSASSSITCDTLTAVTSVTAPNIPSFSPISYSPKLLFGSSSSVVEPTGITYVIQSGTGFNINGWIHLTVDILLSNLGTGPASTDDTYVELPAGLTPKAGKEYSNSYYCLSIGGWGGNSGFYPVAIADNAYGDKIYITKWRNTSTPFTVSPRFDQWENTSRLTFTIIYETT